MIQRRFRKLIATHFNLDELKQICFDLSFAFEDLPGGERLSPKANALIVAAHTRGQLSFLLEILNEERADVEWPTLKELQSLRWDLLTANVDLPSAVTDIEIQHNIGNVGPDSTVVQGSENTTIGAGAIMADDIDGTVVTAEQIDAIGQLGDRINNQSGIVIQGDFIVQKDDSNDSSEILGSIQALSKLIGQLTAVDDENQKESKPSSEGTASSQSTQTKQIKNLGAIQRIVSHNRLIGTDFLKIGLARSHAVGKVILKATGGRQIGSGTGFLVSSNLMLTAHHVLRDKEIAASSQIEFSDKSDGFLRRDIYQFDPERLFVTDGKLDFTLVAVEPISSAGKALTDFGYIPLVDAHNRYLIGESVNLILYPDGHLKLIAMFETEIIGHSLANNRLQYRSGSAPGASGGPVLNNRWELIGMHLARVPRRNAAGKILSKDGSVYNSRKGKNQHVDWIAKEGVITGSIRTHLLKLYPDHQNPLIQELLAPGEES